MLTGGPTPEPARSQTLPVGGRRSWAHIAAAAGVTMVGSMPAFLTGASASLLRADIGIDAAGVGVAVGAFYAASAISSVPGGHLAERLGGRRGLLLAAMSTALVLGAVPVLARDLTTLAACLALGGMANAVGQPASNLAIARGMHGRRAFPFALKQSAGPMATLTAGLVVPSIGAATGWRSAYGIAAVLALGMAWAVRVAPSGRSDGRHRDPLPGPRESSSSGGGSGPLSRSPLVLLAVGIATGTAAATSLGAFLIDGATARGLTLATGGALLVAGSLAGIVVRLLVGWLADRGMRHALGVVSGMLAAGGGGLLLLVLDGPVTFVIGVLLAFAAGWGWVGLLTYVIVQLYPHTPAVATGIVGAGASVGATLGPVVFGFTVARSSYEVAWQVAAGMSLVGAVLVGVARSRFLTALGPAQQQ